MFGLGPAYLFLLQHRLPPGLVRAGWQQWLSVGSTNLAIAVIVGALIKLVGVGPFLLVHLPISLLAASIGVWLFYIQHQFEDRSWDRAARWNAHDAALHGSSHYDLPGVLRWFTAKIGMHHVHHLSCRIPYYRLPQAVRQTAALSEINRLSLVQNFRCVRLVLWSEDQRRLISFRAESRAGALFAQRWLSKSEENSQPGYRRSIYRRS